MIDVEPCRQCGSMCRSDDCGSVLVLKGHTWEAITIHRACRACVERYHDSVRRLRGQKI